MINQFQGKYRFLSNFYPANVVLNNARFPTVEHAYQAAKNPHDDNYLLLILHCKTPGEAKRLGRQEAVWSGSNQLRQDWEEAKINIMLQLLRQKFRDFDLRRSLIATEKQTLVEGNYWHDNFWGNCICQKCAGKEGENHLGLLLMQVRREILEEK